MSTATTLKLIEAALISRYSSMSIVTSEPGAVTPTSASVTVFMDKPSSEKYPERTFPSLGIQLLSVTPDYERSESEDENPEAIGSAVPGEEEGDPPEQAMRDSPKPFRITYSLDTWHRVRVWQDRDLVSLALLSKTPPRSSMTVKNIDNADQTVWVVWAGGIVASDEVDGDDLILHKSLTIDVLADLILSSTVTMVKTVVGTQWKVSAIRTVSSPDGRSVVRTQGDEVKDLVFRILESGPEVVV